MRNIAVATSAGEPTSVVYGKSMDIKGDVTRDTILDKEDQASIPHGSTSSDLIEGFTSGKFNVPPKALILPLFLGWIILISWLFIQDNGGGRLQTMEGLFWFWAKFLAASIFGGTLFIIIFVYWGFINKREIKK